MVAVERMPDQVWADDGGVIAEPPVPSLWVKFPTADGFWWAKPQIGKPVVCEAEECCGVMYLMFTGHGASFTAGNLIFRDEGYRFRRIDVPADLPSL